MTADGKLNDFQHTGIRRDVDVVLAVSVSTHQTGQFELAEVVAHCCDTLARFLGKGAHVTVTDGEQPQDMQPNRGRQQGERGGGVLQHPGRQGIAGRRGSIFRAHGTSSRNGICQADSTPTFVQAFDG